MRSLLDINVLIALLDAQHIHHERAHAWLAEHIGDGWASCPLTQNGFIRIVSQPAYPAPVTPHEAAGRLREASDTQWHEFWPDDINLISDASVDWLHILGSRQITDVYLLALAVQHGGRLVTLDRRVSLAAVGNASSERLVVID